MDSKLFNFNSRDVINGVIMAVGGAVYGIISEGIANGTLDIFTLDWGQVGKVALSATVVYLLKKFFSDSEGKVFGKI